MFKEMRAIIGKAYDCIQQLFKPNQKTSTHHVNIVINGDGDNKVNVSIKTK